ncbi:16998_t:CDS:2, partial [Gigaspora rosea]
KTTSTRQINQRLPLILAINVTGINIIDEEKYLENKDLPEEISFPPDNIHIKQRYRLTGVSFRNGNHHIADVRFENIKNSGWYQYGELGKTYHARAMYIGSARPPHKDGYAMDF